MLDMSSRIITIPVTSACLLLGGFLIFFLMSRAGQKLLEYQENNRWAGMTVKQKFYVRIFYYFEGEAADIV